ncbi:MAG: serine/threonine-protein kinase [Synechococcales bacterium]|nr:serine/threonine-protein kinase [Synechococcales bacterium]
MAATLPLGTLLKQRYLIKQLLGQGGFGRTYLVADQERFEDLCVLKEFTVPYQDEALVAKAKRMFEREASILHQIQHPQIPRFWAAFEAENRLWLVQDFIRGQSYRHLLRQRKAAGTPFTEADILHLLGHLLPVLSYLHDRNIIHRDISPDNIILQSAQEFGNGDQLRLPILIDFGAVKEATSRLSLVSAMTRVGKVGYAPPEQLQTGNVQPHSDLYSLAATCLVLLTGREPQMLLDSQTLTWQWQPHTQISDPLAKVLEQMLSLQPNDRFQSVAEVWQKLHPLLSDYIPPTQLASLGALTTGNCSGGILPSGTSLANFPNSTLATSAPSKTDLATSEAIPSAVLPSTNHPVTGSIADPLWLNPQDTEPQEALRVGLPAGQKGHPRTLSKSFLGNFYGTFTSPIVATATSLVLVLGLGVYLFRMPTLGSTQAIQNTPATADQLPTEMIPLNSDRPQEIKFAAGEISEVVQGNLSDSRPVTYTLRAQQGQIMSVILEGSGVVMNLLRSNQEAIDSAAYQTRSWTGQLPATDEYQIQISGSGSYSLDVAITPVARPQATTTQHVKFDRGQASTAVTGSLQSQQVKRYLIKARGGKIMAIKALTGSIRFSAIAPNGQRIGGSTTQSKAWQGRVPMDGEYVIEVSATQKTDYALAMEIY